MDDRSWILFRLTSLGDYSRTATDAVAIKTLQRVLNAVENGSLNPDRIIVQDRVPIGMFMDESDADSDWEAIKRNILNPTAPLASERPAPNQKWLNKRKFGMNLVNANHFRTSCNVPDIPDSELSPAQLVQLKVLVLAGQIMTGKEKYQSSRRDIPGFNFYDAPED